jgi:hypothetical protein
MRTFIQLLDKNGSPTGKRHELGELRFLPRPGEIIFPTFLLGTKAGGTESYIVVDVTHTFSFDDQKLDAMIFAIAAHPSERLRCLQRYGWLPGYDGPSPYQGDSVSFIDPDLGGTPYDKTDS